MALESPYSGSRAYAHRTNVRYACLFYSQKVMETVQMLDRRWYKFRRHVVGGGGLRDIGCSGVLVGWRRGNRSRNVRNVRNGVHVLTTRSNQELQLNFPIVVAIFDC